MPKAVASTPCAVCTAINHTASMSTHQAPKHIRQLASWADNKWTNTPFYLSTGFTQLHYIPANYQGNYTQLSTEKFHVRQFKIYWTNTKRTDRVPLAETQHTLDFFIKHRSAENPTPPPLSTKQKQNFLNLNTNSLPNNCMR